MSFKTILRSAGQLVLSALLAMLLSTAADMALYMTGGFLRGRYYLALFAALTLGFWCLCLFGKKPRLVSKILLGVAAAAAVLFLAWLPFRNWGAYEAVDSGKTDFYANRRVMLIVPHQDDEINVLGGAIEQYTAYGSELFVVFTTNGDSFYTGETRLQEALKAASIMGVSEDHVIFLGYGDGWKEPHHLYNAPEGQLTLSYTGLGATYGIPGHPAYQEGQAYTFENYLGDLKNVILEHRPEVIFAVDYDANLDHKSTSLLFEMAMGQILKETSDYTPAVFKGYAYTTAWGADLDFFRMNVGATRDVFGPDRNQQPQVYRWADRVRLPVSARALSRSLSGTSVFQALAAHACQDAETHAAGVANGDKVVWYRNTTSLCIHAAIEATSGDSSRLNDFMIYDNLDIHGDPNRIDGIWIPEDSEKSFTVTFPAPQELDTIVLYDHPYEDHNVLNAVITLDNGTTLETGPLHPGGSANSFPVDAAVQSFTVTIDSWEGDLAGIGEVEAFRGTAETGGRLLKLVDDQEDFVYDYILQPSGEGSFHFYTYGDLPFVDETNYTLTWDNDACTVTLDNGALTVLCPQGQECRVTVSCKDAPVSDTVLFRNPGNATRTWATFFLKLEEAYLLRGHKNAPLYQIGIRIVDRLVYTLTH